MPKVNIAISSDQSPAAHASVEIMDSLDAPDLRLGEKRILPRYKSTYSWIFGSEAFRAWVEADGGMLWIKGKPGSGKSVLMKVLYKDLHTAEALDSFTDGPYVRVGFFFWHGGTPLQHSREGLLRSILVNVLRQRPDMSAVLHPVFSGMEPTSLKSAFWSEDRLVTCFRHLLAQNLARLNLCFFIDALDEYGGSPERIARLVEEIGAPPRASMTRVKICFSSRPWEAFEMKFSSYPTVTLQNHTRQDIRQYYLGMMKDSISTAAPIHELVDDVVERADGVFLWVRLVVEDLLEVVGQGTREGQTPSAQKLRQILESLPKTLDDYYSQRIVQRVAAHNRLKMYAVVECLLRSLELLGLRELLCAAECFGCPTYQSCQDTIIKFDQYEHSKYCMLLVEYSGGLIEVRDARPTFMHKSAVDFVAGIEFKSIVLGDLAPGILENGHTLLLKYYMSYPGGHKGGRTLTMHAHFSEKTTAQPLRAFLNSIPTTWFHDFDDDVQDRNPDMINSALKFAAFCGLALYIRTTIQADPTVLVGADGLLSCVLHGQDNFFNTNAVEIIRILLSNGCSAVGDRRFFDDLANVGYRHSYTHGWDEGSMENTRITGIISLLLAHGQYPLSTTITAPATLQTQPKLITCTALHVASYDVAQELLKRNVNPNARDSNGETPLDYIARKIFDISIVQYDCRSFYAIAQLLIQHGGRAHKTSIQHWLRMMRFFSDRGLDSTVLHAGFKWPLVSRLVRR